MNGGEIMLKVIPFIKAKDEAGFNAFIETLTEEELIAFQNYIDELKNIVNPLDSM